jgi:hypothetical protein
MKYMFEYINDKCRAFDERPLFAYLRDSRVDPRHRLNFVPYAAHFVMTFADLYHFFLTEEPPRDEYQRLVNTHLAEEGSHWKWFLCDLSNMDLDPSLRFTDALRFIWSDDTIKTRRLAYQMCRLSGGMSSLQKLVMVLAIEATGRVALEAAVSAGRQVEANSGQKLVYFGQHHLDTEHKHTVEDQGVRQKLEGIVIHESMRANMRTIVDEVFHHFGEFVDETFHLAKCGPGLTGGADSGRALSAGTAS